jgi:hypothetical protein
VSTEKLTPSPPALAQSDDAGEKLAAFKAAVVWLCGCALPFRPLTAIAGLSPSKANSFQ